MILLMVRMKITKPIKIEENKQYNSNEIINLPELSIFSNKAGFRVGK